MTPMDVAGRLPRLQLALGGAGVDALVVSNLTNIRYLSGFTGSAGLLIVAPKLVARDGWPAEIARWDHLGDMRDLRVLGAADFGLGKPSAAWMAANPGAGRGHQIGCSFWRLRWPYVFCRCRYRRPGRRYVAGR